MRRAGWMWGVALLGVAGTAGCNRNCQSTCTYIYDDCQIVTPGVAVTQSIQDCQQECEDALRNAGELGAYNPWGRDVSGLGEKLQNEVQAAAWMDCVWEVGCDNIGPNGQGLCWPI